MRYGKVWTCVALAVVACTSGDTIVGTSSFDALDESLPDGVHARLLVGPYAAGQQTVHVVLQGRDVDFSSYQGVVEFDHETLRLASVSVPETNTHFFNRAATENGGLPIAGFAVDGFDEPIAITLIFSTPRALRTGDLTVHLDVVATSVGAEIPPGQLYENRELIPEGAL
jgi:hypothetical protein